MKALKQFIIILGISFLGYLISGILPIPIPGNVIGMVILTIGLSTGLVKLKHVEDIANFLLDHLALFFIPPAVGIMVYLSLIKEQLLTILLPTVLSIIIGLLITGKTVEFIMKRGEK